MDSATLGPLARLGRARALLPLFGGVFVSLPAFGLAYSARAGFSPAHHQAVSQLLARDSVTNAPDGVIAVFAWPATALVVTAGFVVAIVAFVLIIATTLQNANPERGNRHFLWIIGVVLLTTTLFGVVSPPGTGPGESILGALLGLKGLTPGPTFTVIMNLLAAMAIYFMVAVCCVLCIAVRGEGDARRQELARRSQYLTFVIYVSATNLTVAVLQVYWLFRLPQFVLELHLVAGQHHEIAAGLAAIHGAYFTVLLIGVVGPTASVLSDEARRLIGGLVPKSTPAQQDVWLREQGLADAGWMQLTRIVALLAPLIAGLIGGPLAQAISALM